MVIKVCTVVLDIHPDRKDSPTCSIYPCTMGSVEHYTGDSISVSNYGPTLSPYLTKYSDVDYYIALVKFFGKVKENFTSLSDPTLIRFIFALKLHGVSIEWAINRNYEQGSIEDLESSDRESIILELI